MVTTTLVSINSAGTGEGDKFSFFPTISADGRFVAFQGAATDLVSGLQNSHGGVFVRDLQVGTTALVSVNSAGTDSGNFGAVGPVISANGRVVAFTSDSTDLVGSVRDMNGGTDVFARDLQTGSTTLVSVNSAGTASGGCGPGSCSEHPALSADGRFVVFESFALDLVSIPKHDLTSDVFVRDLQTNTTTLVSVNSAGTASGNSGALVPSISADGRVVAFESISTDLAGSGFNSNSGPNAFARDLLTGTTALVSVNRAGDASFTRMGTIAPVISANGRFVAFVTDASDLVGSVSDANGATDVFVRDLQTNTTTLVSVNSAGTASGNGASAAPLFSADGRFVAFESVASDLVAGLNTNNRKQVFVRDLQTGSTTLVSVNSAGTGGGNGNSALPLDMGGTGLTAPAFSSDGRFLTFESNSDNLVAGLRPEGPNVFVRDLQIGTTTLVSNNTAGTARADGGSNAPVLSADGRFVAFQSNATNLVPNFVGLGGPDNVYRFTITP